MLRRKRTTGIIVCALLLFVVAFAPRVAVAQWDWFSGCVLMPDGFSPVPDNLWIEIRDSDGFEVGYGQTPDISPGDGCFTAFPFPGGLNFPEGDYTVVINTWNSVDFPGNGGYVQLIHTTTYTNGQRILDSPDFYMPLADVRLVPAPRYFRVRFTEGIPSFADKDTRATGDPIVGLELNVSNYDDGNDYFLTTRTDNNGEALVDAPIGMNGAFVISHLEIDISSIYSDMFPNAGSGETLVDFVVAVGNTDLTLNLVDQQMQPYTLNTGGVDGWVACEQFFPDGTRLVYERPVTDGSSSVMLKVAAGEYECRVDIPTDASYTSYFPTSVAHVQVSDSVATSVNVGTYPLDATVRLRALDPAQQPITDACLEFVIQASVDGNNPVEHFDWRTTSTGEVTFNIADGVSYHASVHHCPGAQGNGTNYVIPLDLVPLIGDKNAPNFDIVFPITPTDASITVNLIGPDGNPVSGFIEAYSPADVTAPPADPKPRHARAANDPEEDVWTGIYTTGGPVTLNLVSGRKYFINSFPDFDPADPIIPPGEIEVDLQSGDNLQFTVQAQHPNHTLSLDLEFPEGYSINDFEFLFCHGYTLDGRQAFTEVQTAQSLALSLLVEGRGDYWHVGCDAILPEGADFVYFIGSALYEPDGKSANGSISMSMSDEGSYYEEECWEFNVARDATFVLQDGLTRVEIPAKAFGDEGSAEMCVKTGTGYTYSEEEYPVLTFDLTFTVNGERVTEPSRPVNLWFPVDEGRLAELGATINDLAAGSFNNTVKTWQQDAGAEIRELDGLAYIVVPVSHFSIWGTLINVAQQIRKEFPTNLKAKKYKKKNARAGKQKVLLTWVAPEGATDDQLYEVEYYKVSKKTKKHQKSGGDVWEMAKEVDAVGNSLKRKLKRGKYSFRVRVKDGKDSPVAKGFKVK